MRRSDTTLKSIKIKKLPYIQMPVTLPVENDFRQ